MRCTPSTATCGLPRRSTSRFAIVWCHHTLVRALRNPPLQARGCDPAGACFFVLSIALSQQSTHLPVRYPPRRPVPWCTAPTRSPVALWRIRATTTFFLARLPLSRSPSPGHLTTRWTTCFPLPCRTAVRGGVVVFLNGGGGCVCLRLHAQSQRGHPRFVHRLRGTTRTHARAHHHTITQHHTITHTIRAHDQASSFRPSSLPRRPPRRSRQGPFLPAAAAPN